MWVLLLPFRRVKVLNHGRRRVGRSAWNRRAWWRKGVKGKTESTSVDASYGRRCRSEGRRRRREVSGAKMSRVRRWAWGVFVVDRQRRQDVKGDRSKPQETRGRGRVGSPWEALFWGVKEERLASEVHEKAKSVIMLEKLHAVLGNVRRAFLSTYAHDPLPDIHIPNA